MVISRDKGTEAAPPTAISLLEEALKSGVEHKTYEEIEQIEGLTRAAFSELLSVLFLDLTEHVEPFVRDAKRAFFAVREQAPSDYHRSAIFHLGRLAAIAELAQIARAQSIPSEAAGVVVNSEVARDIGKILLSEGSLRPSDLAARLEKHSQNLHRVVELMVKAGLLRRDEFGKSVMLSATPLTRAAIAYVEHVGATPAFMGRGESLVGAAR